MNQAQETLRRQIDSSYAAVEDLEGKLKAQGASPDLSAVTTAMSNLLDALNTAQEDMATQAEALAYQHF